MVSWSAPMPLSNPSVSMRTTYAARPAPSRTSALVSLSKVTSVGCMAASDGGRPLARRRVRDAGRVFQGFDERLCLAERTGRGACHGITDRSRDVAARARRDSRRDGTELLLSKRGPHTRQGMEAGSTFCATPSTIRFGRHSCAQVVPHEVPFLIDDVRQFGRGRVCACPSPGASCGCRPRNGAANVGAP